MGVNMHTFTYHPVGQGLFFSATFELEDKKSFKLVYDCGSERKSNLIKSVMDFTNENNNIDMLVISHFDYDHISGLSLFLARCSVKKIVMPYLTNVEIMLYLLSHQALNDQEKEWYQSFLRDPLTTLSEYGEIEEILLIHSKKDKDKNIWFKKRDAYSVEAKKHTPGIDIVVTEIIHDNYFRISSSLKFKFFNYPVTPQKLEAFRKKVDNEMIINNDTSINDMAHRILSDYRLTSQFKKNYSYISKSNHNNVSLLLMYEYKSSFQSKNVSQLPDAIQLSFFADNENCNPVMEEFSSPSIIHLLTGDISIKYIYKQRKIYNHYLDMLPNVHFIQVPHHGSKYNWNDDLLKEIPMNVQFIVSHGIGNSYSHPHQEVVRAINMGFPLLRANQTCRINGTFI